MARSSCADAAVATSTLLPGADADDADADGRIRPRASEKGRRKARRRDGPPAAVIAADNDAAVPAEVVAVSNVTTRMKEGWSETATSP